MSHLVWRLYTLGGADYPRLLIGVAKTASGYRLEALRYAHPDMKQDVPIPPELLGDAAILLRVAAQRLNT